MKKFVDKLDKFFKMVKKNTCVFISGKGSNLKSLIINSRDNNFPINIKLVVCNNFKAQGILHAKKNKIHNDISYKYFEKVIKYGLSKKLSKLFKPILNNL